MTGLHDVGLLRGLRPGDGDTADVHHGLTYREYERLPGWRWSHIRRMADSPRHVAHAVLSPDEDRSDPTFRAIHCLLFEGEEAFARSYSVFDGVRRGKLYDWHVTQHPGSTALNLREHRIVTQTAAVIRHHPVVRDLLAPGAGRPEVSLTWTDEATGLPCKARIDWLTGGGGETAPLLIVDLKTIGTTDPRRVASITAQRGYHGQLAHYAAGVRAVYGRHADAYLIAAEGSGAQDVAVYHLDDAPPDGALHRGEVLRRELLTRLAECVATDRWPGRVEGVESLGLPAWALGDEDVVVDSDGLDSDDSEEAIP